MGHLILRHYRTLVKLIYVAGDMSLAFQALPKFGPVPSIILEDALENKLIDEYVYKYKRKCVLIALPFGRDEEERQSQARAMFTGFIRYLKEIMATGAAGIVINEGEFRVRMYLKLEGSTNILASLAPDWFHSFYDRLFVIIVLYE
ncbi:SPOC domain-containing protein [Trichonephila clavata]|uniref:SPOC domain-containing protein n=1 Tax=Trichonephila clavata TaxID=2740835 RepID=A0A8X6IWP9_TRICU|nr:SPOC domain-containing protein [Trichonephila clavata]